MGWGDGAYSWIRRGASFVSDTAITIWNGVTTLPEVGWSYINNPSSRQVLRGVFHVVVEDLLPYVVLNQALNVFQQYIDDSYESNPAAWPTYLTLQAVNTVLQASFFLYRVHNTQRTIARSSVLAIQNTSAWTDPDLRKTEPLTICEDEKCTTTRFVHGQMRGLGVFYLTQLGISLTRLIPYIGDYLSSSLMIYHKGRYVLSSILPEVCQRHNLDYQDANRSLALALGLIHFGSVWSTSQIISYVTNLPAEEVRSLVDFLMLLPTTATAARMDLPKPSKEDAKHWKDPLGYYERFMGWCFDVILYGLKVQVPKLLKGQKTEIDWPAIEKEINKYNNHPVTQFAKIALVSNIFHSIDRLKQDPVIKPIWEPTCLFIADIAEGAVDWGNYWLIKAATKHKPITKLATRFLKWYKGIPPSLSKIIADSIQDKQIQKWLLDLAKTLREESSIESSLPDNFFLRQAQTFGALLERALQLNHDDAYKAASLILDGMIWGAEPIQNQLISKQKPDITNPFLIDSQSEQSSIIFSNENRPERLVEKTPDEKSERPIVLSFFKKTDEDEQSPPDSRANLRLRFPPTNQ